MLSHLNVIIETIEKMFQLNCDVNKKMRKASKHKKETNNSDSQNTVSSQELVSNRKHKKEIKFKIMKNDRIEMKNNCVTLGQNLFNFLIFEATFLCFVREKNDIKN